MTGAATRTRWLVTLALVLPQVLLLDSSWVDAKRVKEPLCVRRKCNGKQLSAAFACFALAGKCRKAPEVELPIPGDPFRSGVFYTPECCWENGARAVRTWSGEGYDMAYYAADGTLCLTTEGRGTNRSGGSLTYEAYGLQWVFRGGAILSTTLQCPSGKLLEKRRAELRCSLFKEPVEEVCELSECPWPARPASDGR
jgi:hypothetical protein